MTIDQTIDVLKKHNAWRRGGEGPQTEPTVLGEAIDEAISLLRDYYKVCKQVSELAERSTVEHDWPNR